MQNRSKCASVMSGCRIMVRPRPIDIINDSDGGPRSIKSRLCGWPCRRWRRRTMAITNLANQLLSECTLGVGTGSSEGGGTIMGSGSDHLPRWMARSRFRHPHFLFKRRRSKASPSFLTCSFFTPHATGAEKGRGRVDRGSWKEGWEGTSLALHGMPEAHVSTPRPPSGGRADGCTKG